MMKKTIFITFLLCVILTLTTVSASDEGSFTDLQNLINNNTDGVVSLDKDYTYNENTDTIIRDNGILIRNNITIDGNGHSLNGANTSRILKSDAKNVNIYNTTFIYGYSQNGAAAIHSQDNTDFTIKNCNFQNNIGTTGTAISSYGNIYVENSQFLNNDGIRGGAIYSEKTIQVINSIFTNNKAIQEYGMGYGGAIYGKGKITINSSSFTTNTGSKGGAVYSEDEVLVENTVFTTNTATGSGGAIYSVKTTTTENTVFNINSAQNSNLGEEANGGAIYTEEGVKIQNSVFNNNNAKEYGGAIYVENEANIENSAFQNNYVITNNEMERGGAISASTVITKSSNYTQNHGSVGGAIDAIDVTSTNNQYQDNVATREGGAISAETTTTTNDKYSKNTANSGGAISSVSSINSNNNQYQDNTATVGGALHSQGTINSNYDVFVKNTATVGGAIYTESSLTVQNDEFRQNKATISGGATYSKTTIIKQSKFIENTANAEGGANFISDNHNPITINYNIYKDNTATNGSSIKITIPQTQDNIDNNWWATNTPNFQRQTFTKTPNTYVILEATSNQNMITTNLNKLNNGIRITENLPATRVTYTSNTGTFSTTTEEFIGTSTTLYQPTTTNTQTATVTVDKQSISLTLAINNQTEPEKNDTQNDTKNETNDTSIITTVLSLENLNKVFNTDKQLTGTLKTDTGENVIGQHVSITLSRTTNGQSKTYDVVTDYTGTFTLAINLSPGQYKADATYGGLEYRNTTYLPSASKQATVTVTTTETTEIPTSLTANPYTESISSTKPLTGTLQTQDNQALPGQHVQIKIIRDSTGGSKTYDIVTDYTGTFSLPINLAVGIYSIQCTYTGIGGYQSSAAYTKLTITP